MVDLQDQDLLGPPYTLLPHVYDSDYERVPSRLMPWACLFRPKEKHLTFALLLRRVLAEDTNPDDPVIHSAQIYE